MTESVLQLAMRLNKMPLDFDHLHRDIYREFGQDMVSGGIVIKIPVLSYRNNKLQHVALSYNMQAYVDTHGPFLFYPTSKDGTKVNVIRKRAIPGSEAPYLELTAATVEPIIDENGMNTHPYLKFGPITTPLIRMVAFNIVHLLSTWHAAETIIHGPTFS